MPDRSHAARSHLSSDNHHNPSSDGVCRWRCPNCGQHTFTALRDQPPDKCDFCADLTTWEFIGSTNQADD